MGWRQWGQRFFAMFYEIYLKWKKFGKKLKKSLPSTNFPANSGPSTVGFWICSFRQYCHFWKSYFLVEFSLYIFWFHEFSFYFSESVLTTPEWFFNDEEDLDEDESAPENSSSVTSPNAGAGTKLSLIRLNDNESDNQQGLFTSY